MQGFYNITERIRVQLAQDVFVNTITYGDIFRVDLKKQTIFPLCHVVVNNATMEGNVFRYNISVMAMDIVDISKDAIDNTALGQFRGNDNEQDVLNTQFAVIARLLKVLESGDLFTELYQLDGNPNIEPFTERFENYLAGWVASFDVLIPNDMTSCDAATIPSPDCEDATAITTDSLGNQLYSNSIPSGATETQVIQDSTVTITDDSLNTLYTLSVNAEGSASQVIQDSTAVLKNTDNTILSTTSINAEASADIVAPDGHVHIKKENDGTIANVFVPSGTTETYDVADNDISVNGILEFDIHATDSLDIRLRDTTNSVVTPNSVTESGNHAVIVIPDTTIEVNGTTEGTVVSGSTVDIQLSDSGGVVTPTSVTQVGTDFQVVLPDAVAAAPRSTATLMRTGQTTVYRTGDDADTSSEGRDTDFFTLDSAPLHNNGAATINTTINRFTDELGGQTYANDIVLDWSTWNGSTLLGYSRVNIATGNTWEQAIDNSLTYSLGTFTSNWRLSNIKEIINILNYQNTRTTLLDYAPLNLSSSSRVYWSSTTIVGTTTAVYAFSNTGLIVQQSKTSSAFFTYIPVRTFSLSTLNVLS
jgi:hypothetical protein